MPRTPADDDPAALERFIAAQEGVHDRALAELRQGRKQSHWMWFVFPQLRGLGQSRTAWFYGVEDADEPPRVYRRVCGSLIRLLFRQHSRFRGKPPQLRSA